MYSNHDPGKQTDIFPALKDDSALAEAKRALGLEPDVPHLVVIAAATPGEFLSELLSIIYICDDRDSEISVLCAGNGVLFRQLQQDLCHLETIHLYDAADKKNLLLDSANLLLTDGQDSSLTEALKRRLPYVLISSAGQEDAHSHPARQGCAAATRESNRLASICIKLLADKNLCAKLAGAF